MSADHESVSMFGFELFELSTDWRPSEVVDV
jgi:hypothetical protein